MNIPLNFYQIKLYSYLTFSQIPVKFNLTSLLGSSGLEPPTSRLSGARSNQLSYEPAGGLSSPLSMEMMGFEPMTPCLQGRCSPN